MKLGLKKKVYFEPLQKAGAADTGGCGAGTEQLRKRSQPPPPTQPRGREHVRFDSIRSDTADRRRDPQQGQSRATGLAAVRQRAPWETGPRQTGRAAGARP